MKPARTILLMGDAQQEPNLAQLLRTRGFNVQEAFGDMPRIALAQAETPHVSQDCVIVWLGTWNPRVYEWVCLRCPQLNSGGWLLDSNATENVVLPVEIVRSPNGVDLRWLLSELLRPRQRQVPRKSLQELASIVRTGVPNGHVLFDSLNAQECFHRILNFFGTRVPCTNIVWLSQEATAQIHALCPLELTGWFDRKPSDDPAMFFLANKGLEDGLLILKEAFKSTRASWVKENIFECHGGNHLLLPVDRAGKTLGYFVFVSLDEPRHWLVTLKRAIDMFAKHIGFCMEHWQLQHLSYLDELTGLYNQRYLPNALDREISRAQRQKRKFSVLFLDVDFFKKVNDTRGHWVGSRLLEEIGLVIKKSLRASDYAFRYGGDEFVVVLVDSDEATSKAVAERVRSLVERTEFLIEGHVLHVTVSIGLAVYPDHAASAQSILELADQAMYYGKHRSRNVVFVAS